MTHTMMTAETVHEAPKSIATTKCRRKMTETTEFRIYWALGFLMFLPFVAGKRLFKAGDGRSVLEEASSETYGVLAFVFMV